MKLRLLALLLIIIVIIVAAVGFFFFNKSTANKLSPSPTITVDQGQFESGKPCLPKQLQADISTEGAAGSIYAKLVLTNTSSVPCQVTLGNSISAKFDADNVSIKYKQTDTKTIFMLNTSAKVYSQVRMPNGPQCTNGVTPKAALFYYDFGTPFSTKDQTQIKIQTCTSTSEQTVVDVWPLSKDPITQ